MLRKNEIILVAIIKLKEFVFIHPRQTEKLGEDFYL